MSDEMDPVIWARSGMTTNWPTRLNVTDAADELVGGPGAHPEVLRVLAEASARLAARRAAEGWEGGALLAWDDAAKYLHLAGVLDDAAFAVVTALTETRVWSGTLSELVLTARAVSAD